MELNDALKTLRALAYRGVDPRNVRQIERVCMILTHDARRIFAFCSSDPFLEQTELWQSLTDEQKRKLVSMLKEGAGNGVSRPQVNWSGHDALAFLQRSRERLEAARKLLSGFKAQDSLLTDDEETSYKVMASLLNGSVDRARPGAKRIRHVLATRQEPPWNLDGRNEILPVAMPVDKLFEKSIQLACYGGSRKPGNLSCSWLRHPPLVPRRLVTGLARFAAAMMYAFGDSARPHRQVVHALVVDAVRWVRLIVGGLSAAVQLRERLGIATAATAATSAAATAAAAAATFASGGGCADVRLIRCWQPIGGSRKGKLASERSERPEKRRRKQITAGSEGGSSASSASGAVLAGASSESSGADREFQESTDALAPSDPAFATTEAQQVPVCTSLSLADVRALMPRHLHFYTRWQSMSRHATMKEGMGPEGEPGAGTAGVAAGGGGGASEVEEDDEQVDELDEVGEDGEYAGAGAEEEDEDLQDEDMEYWTSGGRTGSGRTVPLSSLVAAAQGGSGEAKEGEIEGSATSAKELHPTASGVVAPGSAAESALQPSTGSDRAGAAVKKGTGLILSECEAAVIRIADSQRLSFEGRVRFASARVTSFTTLQYARYLACRELSFTKYKLVRLAFLDAVFGTMQAPAASGLDVGEQAGDDTETSDAGVAGQPRSWSPPADLARALGYFAFDRIGVVVEAALRLSSGSETAELQDRPVDGGFSGRGDVEEDDEAEVEGVAPNQRHLAPVDPAHYARALAILPPAPTELVVAVQRLRSSLSDAEAEQAARDTEAERKAKVQAAIAAAVARGSVKSKGGPGKVLGATSSKTKAQGDQRKGAVAVGVSGRRAVPVSPTARGRGRGGGRGRGVTRLRGRGRRGRR